MIKRFAGQALLVAGCLISAAQAADGAASTTQAAGAVAVNPSHPDTYVVQSGDTLWGISEKFLINPWDWPEVWHINEQVANPHLIYPGQTLRLVWKDGKPSIVADGSASQSTASGAASSVAEFQSDGTVKLKPRIREMPYEAAIPTIPLADIKAFLNDSRAVMPDQLKSAPYLLAGADNRVIMGRGDTVYAREKNPSWDLTYPDYGVYRQGQPYIDPVTGKVLGYEAVRIGSVRVLSAENDVATLTVVNSNQDLRVQDRLLLDDPREIQSVFMPRSAPEDAEGRVIKVLGSIGKGARNDGIVINLGANDGISTGHVFRILKRGEKVRDRDRGDVVELPPASVGVAIVFRTFEEVSYALVLRASKPVGPGDKLLSPIVAP